MNNFWFCTTVHSSFSFLTTEFGFSEPRVTGLTTALEPFPPKPNPLIRYASVVYEKGNQFVEASPGSYGLEFEIILGFCRYSEAGNYRYIYLEDMLKIVAPDYDAPLSGIIDDDLERKFSHLIKIDAKALKTYGKLFFENDLLLFTEIERRNQEAMERVRISDHLARVRCDAVAAFKNEDWRSAISFYTSIIGELTAVEGKRLSIARKRLFEKFGEQG